LRQCIWPKAGKRWIGLIFHHPDARNRRVRPDAEREREHGLSACPAHAGHGGEAGVLQQLAQGEFQVVHLRSG